MSILSRSSIINLSCSMIITGALFVSLSPAYSEAQGIAPADVSNLMVTAKTTYEKTRMVVSSLKGTGGAVASKVGTIRNGVDSSKPGAEACKKKLDVMQTSVSHYVNHGIKMQGNAKANSRQVANLANAVNEVARVFQGQIKQIQARITMLQTALQKCSGGAVGYCLLLPAQIKFFQNKLNLMNQAKLKAITEKYKNKFYDLKQKIENFAATVKTASQAMEKNLEAKLETSPQPWVQAPTVRSQCARSYKGLDNDFDDLTTRTNTMKTSWDNLNNLSAIGAR